jgi:two-component system chemotaxis response regulator CheY
MRICILDDSPIDRAIARVALAELSDVELYESPCGREAEAAIEGRRPDLIIVDWTMPVVNGAAFIRQYRAQGGEARIIVLCHEAERHEMGEAFRVGANHYVLKPIVPSTLLRSVHQVMSR